MDDKDLTVLIPTLNEEKNIKILCERIIEILPKTNILVIDDGSIDKTQQLVKELSAVNSNIQLIDRGNEPMKGLSISIEEGIKQCKTAAFINIDGDLQHPPEALKDALACFQDSADLVIGYRISVEDWPFLRKLISWGAQMLGRFALLVRRRQIPKDLMSGFFGGKTDVILPIIADANIAYEGYKYLFDILKVFPRDRKILQFGYVFKNREFGTSKIGNKVMWEFFKSLFK